MDQTSGHQTQLDSADIARIMQALPHRYPFLMIDKIIEMDDDNSCIGIKNVTVNEPHFQGHFPERPIMPGVLLIEGMAQTAGVLCIIARQQSSAPFYVYFMTIDKCRFRKPVVPGDVVRYHVEKVRNRGDVWKFRAEARVDGTVVAEATVSAMINDK